MNTPQSLLKHEPEYRPQAWQEYTLEELGMWVHLFAKRARHRSSPEKKASDLYNAQNYLDMMQAFLNALKE